MSARGNSKESPLGTHEPEEHTDDMSTGLHLQQFMDEWYYRCIHSGVAMEWDREKCAIAALDLFELQGVRMSKDEKPKLAALDDDEFINVLVKRMPPDVRKAFEHFALQLQLVMSAASRVRCALEEGPPEEVARIMDEGDQGVNSQILKQTVMEACAEVTEVRDIHENWGECMAKRMNRLGQCQRATEQGKIELEKLNIKLSTFGAEQNAKSQAVVMGMAAQSDKALLGTVFKTWWTYKVKQEHEQAIHKKFKKEIDDAQRTLMEYKQAQISNIRSVLMRNSEGSNKVLQTECFRVWAKDVQDEKEEKELKGHMDATRTKMGNLKAHQKENAKQSMMRIVAGNEESMRSAAWQAWFSFHQDYQKNKDFEKLVRAQEERMNDFIKRKSEEAKGVLSKMAGSSDTGLVHQAFQIWSDEYKSVKKSKEMEDMMNNHNAKLASLNARVKGNATGVTVRANELEKENTMMQVFMHWVTEAKLSPIVRHYSAQMDSKKQQLDAVQTMFKSFAQQLEQGISTTPRTTRKGGRSSSRADKSEGQARPPPQPAAQAAS